MSWALTTALDDFWRSPALPMWLTLVAAACLAVVVFAALRHAERPAVAGALTLASLLAVGLAAVALMRGSDPSPNPSPASVAAMPALSCLDEIAGETVVAACERALFSSPEATAAAVSYVAGQLARLAAQGGTASTAAPGIRALRRGLERDRYGLVAHVLATRDGCTAASCSAFQFFSDPSKIAANINARTYDSLVGRHVLTWGAGAVAPALGALQAAPEEAPTGKPTSADFPTSDSIPPVSIMNPEPPSASTPNPGVASQSAPPAGQAQMPRPAPPAAKRSSRPEPVAPMQLTPSQ